MSVSAQNVSRVLRLGGLNPLGSGTPYTREGIRVKRSGGNARVSIDVDRASERNPLVQQVQSILAENGFAFTRHSDPACGIESFAVTGTAADSEVKGRAQNADPIQSTRPLGMDAVTADSQQGR